jgi:Ice-binding-like
MSPTVPRNALRFGAPALFAVLILGCAAPPSPSHGPLTAPPLGTAESFAVLAGSTVTNVGATTIEGNLGVDPGLAVTGFPPGLVSGGTIHAGDGVSLQAQSDLTTAYNVASGVPCDTDLTGQDLGGLTLTRGAYCFSSSAQLTGRLTLDAEGVPDALFIFQIGSTLTTASNSSVLVINGGRGCNVFWQVGSSATLGTTTEFVGDILALTSITLTTGARVSGKALARNGAVTLDSNIIATARCVDQPDAGVIDAAAPPDGARRVDLAIAPPDASMQRDAAVELPDMTECDAAQPADLTVVECDAAELPDLTASGGDLCDG